MSISIKLSTGETFTQHVETTATVLAVKQSISQEKGYPLWSQRLIFQGTELADKELVSDLGLSEDATVHLLIKASYVHTVHPLELLDPISGQLFSNPVKASDGCTYSEESLIKWKESFNGAMMYSPITGRNTQLTYVPNQEVQQELNEYKTQLEGSSHQQPGIITNIDELGAVFSIIDHIREDLAEVLHDWKVPQVVVVGNESIGKSTLLERLAMMPLFPRGERRCTRMKVEIRLRRGANKNPSLKLFRFEPNGDDVLEKSIEVAMETGSEGIQKEMFSLINPNRDMPQICPDKYLVMEITNHSAPNIDLVDMPGMISTPEEEAALIQKMITDQFEKHGEYSMYLFMMEATRNVNQSPISLIKQRPEMEKNTLGVVTHVDKVDPRVDTDRFESLKKLANGEPSPGIGGVPLEPHGFVLTMNASHQGDEFTGFSPIFQRANREDPFFEEMGYGELVSNQRAGCKALVSRLKDMYWEYLEKQWLPKTFEKIEHEIERWSLRDTELGLPRAHVVLSQDAHVNLISAVTHGTKQIFLENMEPIEAKHEVDCLSPLYDSVVEALKSVTIPRLKVNEHIKSTKSTIESIGRAFLEDVDMKFWSNELERVLKEDESPVQLGRFGRLISSYQRVFEENLTESNKSIMAKLEKFLEAQCTDLLSVQLQTNSSDRTVAVSMSSSMAESIRHILSANIHIFDTTMCDDQFVSGILADSSLIESCAAERFELMNKLKLLNIARENLRHLAKLQEEDSEEEDIGLGGAHLSQEVDELELGNFGDY